MTALGITLLLVGAALVVFEAHVPGGVFGVGGGLALVAGAVLIIAALGGGAALAVPIGVGLGAAAGGWTLLAMTKATAARRGRVQVGAEALSGRVGVVRRWSEPAGQVFVAGALWRARQSVSEPEADALRTGDQVVVERVNGLTLCVRRAEEWELF
jgi:membrane-bound serine protease (ClpP class)